MTLQLLISTEEAHETGHTEVVREYSRWHFGGSFMPKASGNADTPIPGRTARTTPFGWNILSQNC